MSKNVGLHEDESNDSKHPLLALPRNVDQIRYLRKKSEANKSLCHDEIYNLHQLAYEEDGFIREIVTYPDSICVVGSTFMVNEVKKLIKERDIVLSYDTTFSVGQCYISPLLFKHTDFIEDPVVAVLFLIHERKLTSSHTCLFRELHTMFRHDLDDIPILIHMEPGIINAIQQET